MKIKGVQLAGLFTRESTTEQSLGGNAAELVGLTVAPMKLATSGQGSPRNPHDH